MADVGMLCQETWYVMSGNLMRMRSYCCSAGHVSRAVESIYYGKPSRVPCSCVGEHQRCMCVCGGGGGGQPRVLTRILTVLAYVATNRWEHAIVDRAPISKWSRDNVTLIGDACHAVTPNMGQGACMAIEDAFVLYESCHCYCATLLPSCHLLSVSTDAMVVLRSMPLTFSAFSAFSFHRCYAWNVLCSLYS